MIALSPNAVRVLEARYLRRDACGAVAETPAELFARVARAVAEAELRLGTAKQAATWQERFEGLMTSLAFLPRSPVLMNAGTALGQLSACFVLPIEDSLESIFDALRAMAVVQRGGGGTGFVLAAPAARRSRRLRRRRGVGPGVVHARVRRRDAEREARRAPARREHGRPPRGSPRHPRVHRRQARRRAPELQPVRRRHRRLPRRRRAPRRVRRRPSGAPRARRAPRRAGRLDRIVDRAWRVGDPGLLYLDAINRANPTPARGDIEATNPCGEVPLLPWESCVLGSVNLAAMVSDGGGRAAIDWNRLGDTVRTGVRFLDDVARPRGRGARDRRSCAVPRVGPRELRHRTNPVRGRRRDRRLAATPPTGIRRVS